MNFTTKNSGVTFYIKQFLAIVFCGFIAFSCVQKPSRIKIVIDDLMVKQFYSNNNHHQIWFSSEKNLENATQWMAIIDSARRIGFDNDTLQIARLRLAISNKEIGNEMKNLTDQQITKLVLHYLKHLNQSNVKFDYDKVGISLSDSVYIRQLLTIKSTESVNKIVSRIECGNPHYLVLKRYLMDSITLNDTLKYKLVLGAMNYLKYINLNHRPEYIVVNIPEAKAFYYKNDTLAIEMRVVLGKKKTQTPTISSYISHIVTFPFWNVPFKIGATEILSKVKKDVNYLVQNNFDVVDHKGRLIDDSKLTWAKYNENNFPYYFRQSTGSDNSLGVINFHLQNPFSIFLHSTNWRGAFAKKDRFLSHGCIRLEKPIELAIALRRGAIDVEELKSGQKNTKTKTLTLSEKIPIFIIYMPVVVDGQKITFLKDVYGLIK